MEIKVSLIENKILFSCEKAQKTAERKISFVYGKKQRSWYLDFCWDLIKSHFEVYFEFEGKNLVCSKIEKNKQILSFEEKKILCDAYKIPLKKID